MKFSRVVGMAWLDTWMQYVFYCKVWDCKWSQPVECYNRVERLGKELRVDGIRAGVRTGHLPNASHELERFIQLSRYVTL